MSLAVTLLRIDELFSFGESLQALISRVLALEFDLLVPRLGVTLFVFCPRISLLFAWVPVCLLCPYCVFTTDGSFDFSIST